MREIPIISLQRLPVYLNYLKGLPDDVKYVSSGSIAEALNMGEVLVRKDLAYTSAAGRPRMGYVREELKKAIEEYLCRSGRRRAVVVGAGALGSALLGYGGFENYDIEIAAAFDCDPEKAGKEIGGRHVYHSDEMEERIPSLKAELALLCVPSRCAQELCDRLVACGIKGILNFAPVSLKAGGAEVRDIDLAANLAVLSTLI